MQIYCLCCSRDDLYEKSQPGTSQVFCYCVLLFLPQKHFYSFFCVHRFDKNQRRCQGTGAGRTFVENALETHKSFQYINHASKCIRQKCLQMAMLKLWEVFLFFLFSWPMDDQMTVHRINGDAIWWSRRKMLFLIICNWIVAEGFKEKHKHSTQHILYPSESNFPVICLLTKFYILPVSFGSMIYLKLNEVFICYRKISFYSFRKSVRKGCKIDIYIFSSLHLHYRTLNRSWWRS